MNELEEDEEDKRKCTHRRPLVVFGVASFACVCVFGH